MALRASRLCWTLLLTFSCVQCQLVPQDARAGLLAPPPPKPELAGTVLEAVTSVPPPPAPSEQPKALDASVIAPQLQTQLAPTSLATPLPSAAPPALSAITIIPSPPQATSTAPAPPLPSVEPGTQTQPLRQSRDASTVLVPVVFSSFATVSPSPTTSSASTVSLSPTSTFSTSTLSLTTYLPLPPPPSTNPAASLPSTTPPALLFPLPSSRPETLSDLAQLGISFGVTFGILAIAAAVSIYIWFRRRKARRMVEKEDVQEALAPSAETKPGAVEKEARSSKGSVGTIKDWPL